ncbi:hypothetical protein ACWEV4_12510 [Streptomyces sp. NPDC003860]
MHWIWCESGAFNAYRGQSWMQEPCRSRELRTEDFGGCRCQAYALTGDATRTDPACARSPDHARVRDPVDRAVGPAPRRTNPRRTNPRRTVPAPGYAYRTEGP